jgi:hypothetical protein
VENSCNISSIELKLEELGGLWIIIASVIAVAIIIDRISFFMEKREEMKKKIEESNKKITISPTLKEK